MRKILVIIAAAMAVLLSGAIATASAAPPSAPTGLEGSIGTVQPVRVLDTRTFGSGPLAPYATFSTRVVGQGDIPSAGVSAVVANVTVTGATSGGYLTVWPAGAANPGTSNLNFVAGQTVPNLVVTTVDANGGIQIFNGSPGTVNVIVDVTGYVVNPNAPTPAQTTVIYRGAVDSMGLPLPNTPAPELRVGGAILPAGYSVRAHCPDTCTVTTTAGLYVYVSDAGMLGAAVADHNAFDRNGDIPPVFHPALTLPGLEGSITSDVRFVYVGPTPNPGNAGYCPPTVCPR